MSDQNKNVNANMNANVTLDVIDCRVVSDAIKNIKNGLDKATQKGIYSLDEVYTYVDNLASIAKSLEALNKYQQFVMEQVKKQKNPEELEKK
jgi:hypothetical protein